MRRVISGTTLLVALVPPSQPAISMGARQASQPVRKVKSVSLGLYWVISIVFRRYAAGEGLRTIVYDLNARGVPPPRAGRRGTGSWAVSSLHAIIHRERYCGVL